MSGKRVRPFISEAQEELSQFRKGETLEQKMVFIQIKYNWWIETEVRSKEAVAENEDISSG